MRPTPRTAGPAARTMQADVVVVGARCAGAATAMLLARAGHDVLAVDRAVFPSDTVSTHVIARTGMVQLLRWGLLPAVLVSGAPPLRSVEFHTPGGVVTQTVKDRHGVDHLLAPRRIILDPILQRAALGSGARIATGVGVDDVIRDAGGRVVGVRGHDDEGPIEIRARYVVGADGLGSRVARSVGAPVTLTRPASGSAQYAYFSGDWTAIEQHVGAGGLAGVFPTHGGEACIWICSPEQAVRDHRRTYAVEPAFSALLAEVAPGLADRVHASTRTSPVRGMLRMPNQFRQASGPGWALVGDAGYHRDAITGYGISDAFRDAELLAAALDEALRDPTGEAGALAAYGQTRDDMARELFDITYELATFPGTARFLELQKQLARAIDEQAGRLAEGLGIRVVEPAA